MFWLAIVGGLVFGEVLLFGLLYNHIKFCSKNISTLDYMGLRQKQYDFSTLTNLKMVFNSLAYFFLPIAREQEFEGYFFPRVMQDPEFNAKDLTIQKVSPKVYASKEAFFKELAPEMEKGLRIKVDKNSWNDPEKKIFVFNSVEIVEDEVRIKSVK